MINKFARINTSDNRAIITNDSYVAKKFRDEKLKIISKTKSEQG